MLKYVDMSEERMQKNSYYSYDEIFDSIQYDIEMSFFTHSSWHKKSLSAYSVGGAVSNWLLLGCNMIRVLWRIYQMQQKQKRIAH